MRKNLCCKHRKPHTGWSSYEHCVQENVHCEYGKVPYWVVFIRVSRVHKIVLWTQKAITRGAWRPGNRPEMTVLEKEGSVIYVLRHTVVCQRPRKREKNNTKNKNMHGHTSVLFTRLVK